MFLKQFLSPIKPCALPCDLAPLRWFSHSTWNIFRLDEHPRRISLWSAVQGYYSSCGLQTIKVKNEFCGTSNLKLMDIRFVNFASKLCPLAVQIFPIYYCQAVSYFHLFCRGIINCNICCVNNQVHSSEVHCSIAWCSALWFNRGTGSKPEIQCFLGLYLRFYQIVYKTNKYIF